MPVLVWAGGGVVPTYALFDSGASCCAISFDLVNKINATVNTLNIRLGTFNNESVEERGVTSFTISDVHESFEIQIQNALVGQILSTENDTPPLSANLQHLPHLADLPFIELPVLSVCLILDAKYASWFLDGKKRKGNENELMGLETAFGWSTIGPPTNRSVGDTNLCILDSEPLSLADEIRTMFRHDFIMRYDEVKSPEDVHMSVNDKKSLEIMENSIEFNEETGHYQMPLSWILGRARTAEIFDEVDFFTNAESRLGKLKCKLEKNPELKKGAFQQMRSTIDQGHAVILSDLSAPAGSPVCYLPIHLDTRKPGKTRVCQDAASRVSGHYLNKYLHKGPDFLNNLVGILLRFRRKKVVLMGDIRNFFYMIECAPEDAPALRFLWWEDESMTKIVVAQSTVHIFGTASSPPIANFVVRRHAERVKDLYPVEVYWAILMSLYVDDFLHSIDSVEEAIEMKKNISEALSRGGFTMTKWKSNFPEVTEEPTDSSLPVGEHAHGGRATATPSSPSISSQEPELGEDDGGNAVSASESSQAEENDTDNEDVDDNVDSSMATEKPTNLAEAFMQAFREDNHFERDVGLMSSPSTGDKVLGVGWCPERDVMYVKVNEKLKNDVKTKGDMLSHIASVYDPCGFVCPYTLEGKIILQQVNELDLGWKSDVPDDLLAVFNRWKSGLVYLRDITIPRWTAILGLEDAETDLVLCCDAGFKGYSMVGYTRKYIKDSFQGGGTAHISFLTAKAHVVPSSMFKNPVKNQEAHKDSIPRLELCAAKLAAVWRDILVKNAGESFANIYVFTDSATVLHWLEDWVTRFKSFIDHRISSIRELSPLSEWRHIPSAENPADLGTKGIKANDAQKWAFFHGGPEFLRHDVSTWPPKRPVTNSKKPQLGQVVDSTIASADIGEVVSVSDAYRDSIVLPIQLLATNSTIEEVQIDDNELGHDPWPLRAASKKQSWSGKVRIVAIVIKTILALKTRVENKKNNVLESRLRPRKEQSFTKLKFIILSPEEKEKAERVLVAAIQNVHFHKEKIALLKLGVLQPNALKELRSKTSRLTNMSPFLDHGDLIRAGGRYAKAEDFPYDAKYPIILPGPSDENVRSLIREQHVKEFHCSRLQTYSSLRQKYYIMGGKKAVNDVIAACVRCQKLFKQPIPQREGDLPPERLKVAAPFATSGVDIFGHFPVRHGGRGTTKRWVLLVTCYVTRAVALFPLKDMSSSTTINALIRLNSQFPSVKKLFSDNGTNFVSADRELREAAAKWNKNELDHRLEEIGVQWTFGPAACGSAGGLWERMVGMVKKLLKSVIGEQVLELDTFETLIAGVAATMNRRPILEASADVDDYLVLSPANFLFPYAFTNSSTSILPPCSDGDALRKSWHKTQELLDVFWLKWKNEYIPSLLKKSKWLTSSEGPKINQMVLIVDSNEPRGLWKQARVIEVLNSDKSHPRRVLLKDAKGKTFHRHITGIVPLELDIN